ncbi:MAG TPA: Calx-beta domain-containing protein, partial [Candidatus Saccharimonadales bacterium]|nr:Calx-beta domain-containing protein [Candidatus Saccharimonadales bacterium]
AKAGSDYGAQSGTLTFAAGQQTQTITVPILDDSLPEELFEHFQIRLTNPSFGAALGSADTKDITIVEDEAGVEFSAAEYTANEIDQSVEVTVRRIGNVYETVPMTVDFAMTSASATAGQDFLPVSVRLRFAWIPNDVETVKTFRLPILDDTLVEGDETFLISLSNPSPGVLLGPQSTATVVIHDNDSAAGPGRGANAAVQAILPLADGKAIIAGDFTFVDGAPRSHIARINENTTLDGSFDPGLGTDGTVFAVASQPDGKVLLGGSFTNVNGVPRNGIARLNPEGSLDPMFDPGLGVQGISHGIRASVRSMIVQTNGQILIGGFFSEYGGLARSGIARLNPDASVDAAFNPSYGQDAVFPMLLQPDGKILAGGYFKVSGLVVAFARLNADGTVDSGFSLTRSGLILASITSMALQPDGKILMLGTFAFDGTNRSFIGALRFNRDGSVDDGYGPAYGISGNLKGVVLQNDGKLLVGYVAIEPGGVLRLQADGTRDTSFAPQVGEERSYPNVLAVALQPAGTILIGGSFASVNGQPRHRIARLDPDGMLFGSVALNLPRRMADGSFQVTTSGEPTTELVIETSSNLVDWIPIYTNTTVRNRLDFIDTAAPGNSQRWYRTVARP